MALYRQGVEAGERALGPGFLEENKGYFWGVLETRPYMRARWGLAECLWGLGRKQEAIEHAQALLELNENDNQGIRYVLAAWLLDVGDEVSLEKLLKSYEDDCFAGWPYTAALLSFRQKGDTKDSKDLLRKAMEANPHVPTYLLGEKKLPKHGPDYMGVGDESEAIAMCLDYAESWMQTRGALSWLKKALKAS